MRRLVNWLVFPAFVLGMLVFAGSQTALADGGRHGYHGRYDHHRHHDHRQYYRPPIYGGAACYPPRYPAYSVRAYQIAPPYAVQRNYYGGQTGFYSSGPNYSFGINYGW